MSASDALERFIGEGCPACQMPYPFHVKGCATLERWRDQAVLKEGVCVTMPEHPRCYLDGAGVWRCHTCTRPIPPGEAPP